MLCATLVCVPNNVFAQSTKLGKNTIFKDGTTIKYIVGDTYKLRSFSGERYGEDRLKDVDTISIKFVEIDEKLYVYLNENKANAFLFSKDQTPEYFYFDAYNMGKEYFDLLLPLNMVNHATITTYNIESNEPMKSNYYKYSTEYINIKYNGEDVKLKTKVYKSEYMNDMDFHFIYTFNNDKSFPLLTKTYFIVDNNTFEGLFCTLFSIKTRCLNKLSPKN